MRRRERNFRPNNWKLWRPGFYPGASVALDFTRQKYRVGAGSFHTKVFGSLPGLTVTRAHTNFTNAYAEDSFGSLIPFAANIPRITNKGLLVEESRTNLLLRSQEFDNASWTKSNVTITANQIVAPDGTLTADLVTENTAAGTNHSFYGTGTTLSAGGTVYTTSVFLKAGTIRYISLRAEQYGVDLYPWVTLDTQTGALNANAGVTSSSATALADGWWRVVLTWANSSGSAGGSNIVIAGSDVSTAPGTAIVLGNSYTGTGKTFYVWAAQLEAGSFPTSYIPTTTATATRAADVVSIASAGGTIGTYYANVLGPPGGLTNSPRIIGSGSSAHAPLYLAASYKGGTYNGTTTLETATTGKSSGQRLKLASAGNGSGRTVVLDGAQSATDANAYLPTLSGIYLGSERGSTSFLNSYIESALYYPEIHTVSQMLARTQ